MIFVHDFCPWLFVHDFCPWLFVHDFCPWFFVHDFLSMTFCPWFLSIVFCPWFLFIVFCPWFFVHSFLSMIFCPWFFVHEFLFKSWTLLGDFSFFPRSPPSNSTTTGTRPTPATTSPNRRAITVSPCSGREKTCQRVPLTWMCEATRETRPRWRPRGPASTPPAIKLGSRHFSKSSQRVNTSRTLSFRFPFFSRSFSLMASGAGEGVVEVVILDPAGGKTSVRHLSANFLQLTFPINKLIPFWKKIPF